MSRESDERLLLEFWGWLAEYAPRTPWTKGQVIDSFLDGTLLAAREPPATEQRYWRVDQDDHPGGRSPYDPPRGKFYPMIVNAEGFTVGCLSREGYDTRAVAVARCLARSLPEWQPALPAALPTEPTVPWRTK